METQANATGQPQSQQPVHPIHQEQADINSLTEWIQGNRDNDPHAGTDLELPPDEEQEETAPVEAEAQPEIEIDEETPLIDIEYKTETGKEIKKLSLKELREGYLAKQDYHRNIQKVKAQEAQIQKQVDEARLAAANDYIQRLEVQKQAVIKTIAPELQNVDLNKLAQEDPAEAQRLFFRQIQVNQALQGIEQEQRQAAEKLKEAQQSQFQQAARTAWETLSANIPDWNEAKYNDLLKFSREKYGFDATRVVDANLLTVLHDAQQFRSLKEAKPEVNKRVVAVPKVLKPGSGEKTQQNDAVSEAEKRLAKSGKDQDFMDWYLASRKQQQKSRR